MEMPMTMTLRENPEDLEVSPVIRGDTLWRGSTANGSFGMSFIWTKSVKPNGAPSVKDVNDGMPYCRSDYRGSSVGKSMTPTPIWRLCGTRLLHIRSRASDY